jgi:drug/metabolite transporter (DMT)-like permease
VPITVAVLAWLTGGSDRLTITRWAGLLAALAGVALLAGAQCKRGAGWPITEVLLVAVCYAIGR